MRAAVAGVGAVGARVLRQLLADDAFETVSVDSSRPRSVRHRLTAFGDRVDSRTDIETSADVLVVATPAGTQLPIVRSALGHARLVITTGDDLDEIRALLRLGDLRGTTVIVGAGFSPGLSCLVVSAAAAHFVRVDEVYVAKAGTGGPACAVQHHRALGSVGVEWRDGHWLPRPGGSGRELCWFPDPVGARDCYRAELAEPVLLATAMPELRAATARVAATRRDRLTSWMPMLVPPPDEGGVGAIRVELRGDGRGGRMTEIYGAAAMPAIGAAAVAASTARHWAAGGWTTAAGLLTMGQLAPADRQAILELVHDQGIRLEHFGLG
jgi:saccharopine dehydrogenase-like NADP-dependent oxidoreductase